MAVLKMCLGAVLIILGLLVWCEGRIVLYNDYSTLPLDPQSNPDLNAQPGVQRPGVYLVTYADGPEIFFKNQHALSASALNRGVDFILNYRRSHLDSAFIAQHRDIFDQKQGAGFWLWKPWIIAHTLRMVPEGSIVIYADSGFVFYKSVVPYIDRMAGKDVMLVDYDPQQDGYPIEIAKRDVFVRAQCDQPDCWNGSHTWAGFMMLRNTPKARSFVGQWLDLCSDGHLLMDGPSVTPAHKRQKKHHHDEAILSVLYNAEVHKGADYLTLLPVGEFGKVAYWHHRHPGRDFESLLHKTAYHDMRRLERDWFLNSFWMKKIREYFLPPAKSVAH